MPKWWVYHYFPTAYFEDLKRYWQKEVISELNSRGLEVSLKIEYSMENIRVMDCLSYAENRDISVLTLIDEKDYEEGLERMRYGIFFTKGKVWWKKKENGCGCQICFLEKI